MSSARPVRGALLASVLVLCALGALELRLSALHRGLIARRQRDEATVPSAGAIRLLALGHREWAADLLWSTALVYFGETMAARQEQRYLQRYAATIEQVDPRFRQAYLWGAMVSVYNARTIRRGSVENAIAHLRRGLEVFPDDGEMLYQLGFNYYFELAPMVEGEERRAARRTGAEFLRRASALGHGPPWMAFAAVGALEEAGMTDRAIQQLRDLYERTEDEAIRARIARQIARLAGEGGGRDEALRAAARVDAERRAAFPYVPPLLYRFVGPPVPAVVGAERARPPAPTTE